MLFSSTRKQQRARSLSKYSLSLLKAQKYSGKREELHEAETLPHLPLTLANKAGRLYVGEITGESSGSTSGKVPLFLFPSTCLLLFSYAATKNEQQKEQQKNNVFTLPLFLPMFFLFETWKSFQMFKVSLHLRKNLMPGNWHNPKEALLHQNCHSPEGLGNTVRTAWNSNTPQG